MNRIQVPADEIGNEEANELADEILQRGEFLGSREPGLFQRAVDRVLEWIGDLIARIFGTLFGGAGSGAGAAVAYVLLGVAIVVIGFAIYRALSGWSPRTADVDEPGARIVFDEVVDPAELRTQLAAQRAAGDWRAAVITGFRLAVVGLIDAGIANERPGATTGDFGRAVQRNRPELSTVYRDAAASFDRAFYSDAVIDETDHVRVTGLLEQLERVAT